jgi:Cyclin
LIVALVLAIKYLDDEIYSNAYYARVGGLSISEMNRLEASMLELLRWNVSVSAELYNLFEESLASGVCTSDGEDDIDDLDIIDDDLDFSTSSMSSATSGI